MTKSRTTFIVFLALALLVLACVDRLQVYVETMRQRAFVSRVSADASCLLEHFIDGRLSSLRAARVALQVVPRQQHVQKFSAIAQELFQAIRWNNGFIAVNTEQASKMMNLTWPVKGRKNLYKRVNLVRKTLRILKDNEFINYKDEAFEKGDRVERKAWTFYVRKKKLIKFGDTIN